MKENKKISNRRKVVTSIHYRRNKAQMEFDGKNLSLHAETGAKPRVVQMYLQREVEPGSRSGKFVITKGKDGNYYFNLKAGNG
jgi:hypothetical protein